MRALTIAFYDARRLFVFRRHPNASRFDRQAWGRGRRRRGPRVHTIFRGVTVSVLNIRKSRTFRGCVLDTPPGLMYSKVINDRLDFVPGEFEFAAKRSVRKRHACFGRSASRTVCRPQREHGNEKTAEAELSRVGVTVCRRLKFNDLSKKI